MPLFPFVWQYNNQPIGVLADNVSELIVNSGKYIPLSDGLQFIDSTIVQDTLQNKLETQVIDPISGNSTLKGMKLDYANNKYRFGDYDGDNNGSTLVIDDPGHYVSMFTDRVVGGGVCMFRLDGTNDSLEVFACTATTAGAAVPNLFLKLAVAGTQYKIQLLADA
jgi:hypothetical protein